jgi:hypothetical protein
MGIGIMDMEHEHANTIFNLKATHAATLRAINR